MPSKEVCMGINSWAAQVPTKKAHRRHLRCGWGPQGRVDPKTKIKALSLLSVGWTDKMAGWEGRSFWKRWMKNVLLHHYSHSHIPATVLEGAVNKYLLAEWGPGMFNSFKIQCSNSTAIIIKNSIYMALYYFTSTLQLSGNLHNTL